ncbi:Endonuclease/Exonuclease/phosphatase family protein [Geosmithia morbida]|uniref:Endonuclease/Exonuclease/phosphatase family protein n=1 Tax=Geosmithia morbida TaxID=1094350 RepID=A0A9P4YRK8_9HYPO|nr:Endonuclease/Exonuclease/phosphatase family protein [Geosmithia morbida]KAF4121823.1 Endonuclease/Exonuclease/phosphatase family protein [Geosmithia morbida]
MSHREFAARRRQIRSSPPVLYTILFGAALILGLAASWYGRQEYQPAVVGADVRHHHQSGYEHQRQRQRQRQQQEQERLGRISADQVVVGGGRGRGGRGRDSAGGSAIRIITYNVRHASPATEVVGEQPWRVRLPKLCAQLRFMTTGHTSVFLCLQETLHEQLTDVQSCLGPGWSYVGQGRSRGRGGVRSGSSSEEEEEEEEEGEDEDDDEFSPIFYRSDTWSPIIGRGTQTRRLSETPLVPSRGWDASVNRIVTVGHFTTCSDGDGDGEGGVSVVIMNVHLDRVGARSRPESARMIADMAGERSWSSASALFVVGDFNSSPEDEAYRIMTGEVEDGGGGGGGGERAGGGGGGRARFSDMAHLVAPDEYYGHHLTYTTFGEPDERPSRIDYLFIREPRTAVVRTFGVLPNSFDDHVRLSDHRPVVSDVYV